ncbi:MAG: 4Fe-4S dicluster domain-containing protein [Chloroflexota bacterium]
MSKIAQADQSNPTPSRGVPTRKNGPRGKVFLYGKWCKGCHICVTFCPTGTLAMNGSDDHPIVAHPENCTACHFCDTHCPDLAIVVKKLE